MLFQKPGVPKTPILSQKLFTLKLVRAIFGLLRSKEAIYWTQFNSIFLMQGRSESSPNHMRQLTRELISWISPCLPNFWITGKLSKSLYLLRQREAASPAWATSCFRSLLRNTISGNDLTCSKGWIKKKTSQPNYTFTLKSRKESGNLVLLMKRLTGLNKTTQVNAETMRSIQFNFSFLYSN